MYEPTQDYYIPLTFTLYNTNITVNLLVTGLGYIGNGGTFPSSHSWINKFHPERFFTYEIPSTELRKLVPPGKWTATLKQSIYQWSPLEKVASWQSNITLNVTDLYRPSLYFPAFPSGNAVVDLRLNNRPGTVNNVVSSGKASLDMCLYDGGMWASKIALIFQDEGKSAPGRSSGQFSVYKDGGDASIAADRLDYEVKVLNPTTGNMDTVTNGMQINWSNTNARNIKRQVVLPGVPGISLCVPAPITLITPAFNIGDKSTGHYTGKLRVIYTPSTY